MGSYPQKYCAACELVQLVQPSRENVWCNNEGVLITLS